MSLIKLSFDWVGLAGKAVSAGSKLMQNSTIRNAAIGAGTGAVVGAVTAPQGQSLSNAVKGGLIGGATGGLGTLAAGGVASKQMGGTFMQGVKQRAMGAGDILKNTLKKP